MTDANLLKFFRSKLAPLRPTVLLSFANRIDADCESYFEEVFEPAPIVAHEDMISSLISIWQRHEMKNLVALESGIRKIANELKAPESADQHLSDLIYAMY